MREVQLTAREHLCDLQMVKAEYGAFGGKGGKSDHRFGIKLVSSTRTSPSMFEEEGELFAAELEALAAIIRSRVSRARMIGEERS